MSEDLSRRTHAPTPRRIREFRKRGEVAVSKDVTTIATMAGGLVGAVMFAGPALASIGDLMRESAGAMDGQGRDLLGPALRTLVVACAPVVAGGLVGYLAAAAAQLGWPPVFKKPSLDLSRPFQAASIGRILSPRAAAGRLLQATAKVALVLAALLLALWIELHQFERAPALEPGSLAARLGRVATRLCGYAGVALAALAAVDWTLARRRLSRRMKMTNEELKREHKEHEGDPVVVSRRRRRMRELATRRLAVAVRSADVVLVNPTHYAVALRYDSQSDSAPRVVAKGRDSVAAHVRELARRAGVPVLARPSLTRFLYRAVPEGREIPVALYQAVAEVLAYIYGLRTRRAR